MSVEQAKGAMSGECPYLRDALADLCEQCRLIAIYAFGSRAREIAARVRGDRALVESPFSDLDIGVLSARGNQLLLDDKVVSP